MTKEELDQLEALANAMIVPDHGTLALVAAVRERDAEIARLRALVEQAYAEGQRSANFDQWGHHEGFDPWDLSDAKRALDMK